MTEFLIVSNIVSWLFLLGLSLLVLALARQIGVMHERIKPVGALALGKVIKAGQPAPHFTLPSLTGGTVELGGVAALDQSTLLFFLSPTCPVCKTLLPVLQSLRVDEMGWLQIVLASDGKDSEHRDFIRQHDLDDFPYLNSTAVGLAYQIAKLPYGVLISPQETIAAHGLINNREHLESLIEAKSSGYSSVQELQRSTAPH